jgi:hypothetical protein
MVSDDAQTERDGPLDPVWERLILALSPRTSLLCESSGSAEPCMLSNISEQHIRFCIRVADPVRHPRAAINARGRDV